MAGGEQQRQFFVVQLAGKSSLGFRLPGQGHKGSIRRIVTGPGFMAAGHPQRIDGFMARHAVQPAGRVGRHTLRQPDFQSTQRGRLHRVFGQPQVRQAQ